MYRYNHSRYQCPLYKAFKKYGIDNFTIEILYDVPNPTYQIKSWLDRLEISYIEKYNSYGHTGYNQTRGGDRSTIGLKMTDVQKKAISERMKKYAKTHNIKVPIRRKPVYIYDILNNCTFCFKSRVEAASKLNICRSTITEQCQGKTKAAYDRYLCADDEETLKEKIGGYGTSLRE